MSTILIMLLPVIVMVAAIPIVIGTYVYRDATQRGINAVLWTLIALFAPMLIGFIIYLLMRSNYPNLKCQNCNEFVNEEYVVCPKCNTKLRPACPNCSAAIETGWIVCPKCAQPLQEFQNDITPPIKPKDQMLGKILLLLIAIPVLVIISTTIAFSTFSTSSSIASCTSMTIDEYMQTSGNQEVETWMEHFDTDYSIAYVLQYEKKSGNQIEMQYLIYSTSLAEDSKTGISNKDGLLQNVLEIDYVDGREGVGNNLLIASYAGKAEPKLKISHNGKRIDCKVTKTTRPLKGNTH